MTTDMMLLLDEVRLQTEFPIPTTCTIPDQISLLLLQEAITTALGSYTYLEFGSFKGGSLVPHLRHPGCERVYSVDPRPRLYPDGEGSILVNAASAGDMAKTLSAHLGPDTLDEKFLGFSADSNVPASEFVDEVGNPIRAHLFFFDGEPTDAWALSDFQLALQLSAGRGAYVFQNASKIPAALKEAYNIMLTLDPEALAYPLVGDLFVIERKCTLIAHPLLRAHQVEFAHLPYFKAQAQLAKYQAFYRRPLFTWLRGLAELVGLKK